MASAIIERFHSVLSDRVAGVECVYSNADQSSSAARHLLDRNSFDSVVGTFFSHVSIELLPSPSPTDVNR